MALPNGAGGYQLGDGNLTEVTMGVQGTPATATSTATLTAAQITSGIIVADPSTTAATYTLPTVALTEAVVTSAKINSTFRFALINLGTSTGDITVAVGTGWTLVGAAVVNDGTTAQFVARKTGDGTWTAYRLS